jgi:hypothetical protein
MANADCHFPLPSPLYKTRARSPAPPFRIRLSRAPLHPRTRAAASSSSAAAPLAASEEARRRRRTGPRPGAPVFFPERHWSFSSSGTLSRCRTELHRAPPPSSSIFGRRCRSLSMPRLGLRHSHSGFRGKVRIPLSLFLRVLDHRVARTRSSGCEALPPSAPLRGEPSMSRLPPQEPPA